MKLRRSAAGGRPRLRHQAAGDQKAKPFLYRASRSEAELNTGRTLQRPAERPNKPGVAHFWLQRFGLIVLSLAIIVSVINLLMLSPNARVFVVSNTQPSAQPSTQTKYAAAADKLLHSSIWNHNKLTINTAQLSRQLLEQFPELASASVTIPLVAHRPIIYIQPAQAAVILTNNSGVYVLDTSGRTLLASTNAASLQLPSLPIINDQSGLKLQPGHQALPAADIGFIQTVVAQLAAKHITVSSMMLPAAASELDVHLTGQPFFAKFNLENNDPLQQVGTLLATMAQLQKQNITPAKYIDVRVDGRAYYQ